MPDYTIPVWHPVTVHFPIVLLLVAALAAVVWAWRGSAAWRGAALLLMALGTAGAFASRITGEAMAEQSEGVPVVEMFIENHEKGALWTVITGALATAALLAAWYAGRRGVRVGWAIRAGIALLALAAAALVAWTGHLGGLMVWGVPG